MPRKAKDADRENRIAMEIIVDAYGPEEQALGWYYYLEEHLQVPFQARCTALRSISPLEVGDEVEVIGMPPETECEHEMFVQIRWGRRPLAVPLAQLEGIGVDEDTRAATHGLALLGRAGTFVLICTHPTCLPRCQAHATMAPALSQSQVPADARCVSLTDFTYTSACL